MKIDIRRAQEEDIPFLGWVMYTAARSHLETCPWSAIFGEDEAGTRKLLEHVARTPATHWCHVSKFWIAEANGIPAAAMSGFTPATEGTPVLAEVALGIAASELGYSDIRLDQVSERLMVAAQGLPDDLPDVWAVENVAVLPGYRGRGLIDRLFEQVLDEGRKLSFKRAQILCLIGNICGQRAWERNGFAVLTEKLSPSFDELIGTPGAKLLARDM